MYLCIKINIAPIASLPALLYLCVKLRTMKVTPTDQQADFLRWLAIIIIVTWLVWVFQKYFFLAIGIFAFFGSAVWAWLSFLNPESIIARRDNFEEPEYGSAYEEYRQTGVDRRNSSKKSDSSEKPDNYTVLTGEETQHGYGAKVCAPCAFTGVVTDAERNAFDWPEFTTPKNK